MRSLLHYSNKQTIKAQLSFKKDMMSHKYKDTAVLCAFTEYSVQEVGVVAVIGVSLCSFFLGIMLTIGLWCIHKKTGES